MFCCYHQPSPDKSSISNQCQGKGKSGREWVVPGEGGKGKALRWLRVRLRGGGGGKDGGMGVILQIIKQSNKITGE